MNMITGIKFPFPTRKIVLPIMTESKFIGYLVPVDHQMCNSRFISEVFSQWRNKHMDCFLSSFPATPQRTRNWLNNVYLPDPDRILFAGYSYPEFELVCHYGMDNVTDTHAEMDNGLRGNPTGAKGFMTYMEIALLSLMFGMTSIHTVNLYILSDNEPVKRWHERVGYTYGKVHKLTEEVKGDTTYLVPDGKGKPVDVEYWEMVITKEQLVAKHPWVKNTYAWRDNG
jgi:hypothetical protein